MIKEQIQECIQRILDNELGGISTNNCPRGGIEKYRYMTAYRLSKYVNFYRTHRISLDDLLISLRNYLFFRQLYDYLLILISQIINMDSVSTQKVFVMQP